MTGLLNKFFGTLSGVSKSKEFEVGTENQLESERLNSLQRRFNPFGKHSTFLQFPMTVPESYALFERVRGKRMLRKLY